MMNLMKFRQLKLSYLIYIYLFYQKILIRFSSLGFPNVFGKCLIVALFSLYCCSNNTDKYCLDILKSEYFFINFFVNFP